MFALVVPRLATAWTDLEECYLPFRDNAGSLILQSRNSQIAPGASAFITLVGQVTCSVTGLQSSTVYQATCLIFELSLARSLHSVDEVVQSGPCIKSYVRYAYHPRSIVLQVRVRERCTDFIYDSDWGYSDPIQTTMPIQAGPPMDLASAVLSIELSILKLSVRIFQPPCKAMQVVANSITAFFFDVAWQAAVFELFLELCGGL